MGFREEMKTWIHKDDELIKLLEPKKVKHHVIRIMEHLGDAFIPDIPTKVTLKSMDYYLQPTNENIEITKSRFKVFFKNSFKKLIFIIDFDYLHCVYADYSKYLYTGIDNYEYMKEQVPLFYKTLEMDDEEFDLWFKLQ